MPNPITNSARLAVAGLTLTWYGVALYPSHIPAPLSLRILRVLLFPLRALGALIRAPFKKQSTPERLINALTNLGPTYIKLGQFLATRSDIIGKELANDLSALQDSLPPFSQEEAEREIERQLGKPVTQLFKSFGPPIAAASIAQVHKATIIENGIEKEVAVKILRPGIERRFKNDQASFRFAAGIIESLSEEARRLRPVEVVKTLDRSMTIELDLRLEASALSELEENTKDDPNFKTPNVVWPLTTQRVLTTEWIDATPIAKVAELKAAGHDLEKLGTHVLQSFLRQAMRDGFFHADMHPGNLFIDKSGNLVAIDCGIMGRLSDKEQAFLARILHGFITRDYREAALAHFEAGYVPPIHSVDEFAQGLRAIGEPIADRPASEVSMARFLGQLFEYTAVYDMKTRPELILLQKNLVIAEGVARMLNPELNLWRAAEPVVKEWLTAELGPAGKMRRMAKSLKALDQAMDELPTHLSRLKQTSEGWQRLSAHINEMDDRDLKSIFDNHRSSPWPTRAALWIAALSLAAIALKQWF